MWKLLKRPAFFRLWLSQLLMGLGHALFEFSAMAWVYAETDSALLTAGVMVANALPRLLASPFAGVMVDRFSRRRVMIWASLLQAVSVSLLPLILLRGGGGSNVWVVYLITALLALWSLFDAPARQALVPLMVDVSEIVPANSLIGASWQSMMGVGFLVGGLLVRRFSFSLLVLMVVGLMALAAVALLWMGGVAGDDGHSVAEKAEQPPILRQFKDGFVYLREHRLGRALVTMEIFEHIPHGIWSAALLLVFVESALNGDTTDWGNFNASFFFGLLGGSIIATMLTKAIARRPGWFIILNAFLSAALTWAFAVSGNILFAIIVAMAFGVPFALRDVAQNSLLQANVDNKMLGRVFALRETGLSVMFMFSSLFFAALADFVEIRTIYLIGAVLYLGTTIYALGNKALRESRIEDDNGGE